FSRQLACGLLFGSALLGWHSGGQLPHVVGEPRQRLYRAPVGAVVPNHPVALGGGREHRAQGDAGARAAEVLERDGGAELHRLYLIAAAVVVADALGFHDLVEGDAVVIVATVGAVHDEAPHAAGAEFERLGCGGEPEGTPPTRQMLRGRPRRPNQFARRFDDARGEEGSGVPRRVEAISLAHALSPWPGAHADSPPAGRDAPATVGGSARANRPRP